jgi:N-acetylmuramoyl-L-alanine amidase
LPKGGEQAVDDALFRSNLLAAGYADLPLETLLPAFRLRHRAWHAGALDTVDMALSAVLADRYPVVDPNGEWA